MSEWDKMSRGELYSAANPDLQARAKHTRAVLREFNATGAEAMPLLAALFGAVGKNFYIETGFFCDYGGNITVGDDFYANAGVVILDVCPVTIGNHCLIGPQVGLYTATHPLDAAERLSNMEFGRPITIGDNVWIGGHAVINPGVTIGDNAVIASGAVVTRNVAPNTVVGGNPAKCIKRMDI